MAGYRRKAKLYTLRWAEGHELHGLEVTCKDLTVERMLALVRLSAGFRGDMEAKLAGAEKLFREFARYLVEWNLEDGDGDPVPATYDGIAAQDLDFVIDLVSTWIDAVASVDTPLPQNSNGGQPSAPALSMPMEPLSPSPPS